MTLSLFDMIKNNGKTCDETESEKTKRVPKQMRFEDNM